MKKYTIELPDDLSIIYEDIAAYHQTSIEAAIQIVLTNVVETILKRHPDEKND